ncbi:MAG: regulator SirB [Castellaniella sp.]|uniref:SirB2 family protein n=1 Tax=Castellaniella sp. TaxID=1955812 RepID=UPI00122A9E3A|nr:SirB2 family protein [Castellaniella sp.]TAN27685.1 MAG: regulator SirB [Castellaniella sp.]
MEYYLPIKNLHMTAVGLSILFFVIRAYWSITGSALLQHRVVRIVPHIVDSVLLICGVILAMMIGPNQPWILTKIILLVFYIGVGTIAIKRGRTPTTRLVAALVGVAIFIYIVGVAIRHDSASWFA